MQNASTSKPQESATKADAPTESILPDGRELRSRGTAEEGEEKSIEPLQMTTSTGGIGYVPPTYCVWRVRVCVSVCLRICVCVNLKMAQAMLSGRVTFMAC
jgi:hypothetical protein